MLFIVCGLIILAVGGYFFFSKKKKTTKSLVVEPETIQRIRSFVLTKEIFDNINKERVASDRRPLDFNLAQRMTEWRAGLSLEAFKMTVPGGDLNSIASPERYLVCYEPFQEIPIDKDISLGLNVKIIKDF